MTRAVWVIACVGFVMPNVFAQSYSEIDTMLDDRKYSDVDRILKSRLIANASDDSAMFFLGQIAVRSRDVNTYDDAVGYLNHALSLKPNSSAYHLWLARVYGLKALDGGLFKAMSYAGVIKEEFTTAAELDPKNFQAQYDLIQFYLQAPGIAGGSVSKARDVAERFEKFDREETKLLRVPIQVYENEYDAAAAMILSAERPSDKIPLRTYRFALSNVGSHLLDNEEPAMAQTIYQKLIEQFPNNAAGYHGLGRSLQNQQKISEAIAQYEKAISLSTSVGSQYRLGLIYEAKGDKQKAIKYYEEFLSVQQNSKDKTVEDARDRLDNLRNK